MAFVPFELERWQSQWEHRVRFNLAESGVHPLTVEELLQLAEIDSASLHAVQLGYSQSDGTDELRHAIAGLYPGATEANVLVTVGSSEANFIACWSLLEPDDHVAILSPLYRQTWGLAKNFGARISSFTLQRREHWDLDVEDIDRAITPHTKLVVVTNPNNPTGRVLPEHTRKAIVERVERSGSWLLADEVYQGAELTGGVTQSFWGSYERLVIVNGLSKAYGLPGLRIGWVVAPPQFKQQVYQRHDYTVICPSATSDFLARCALRTRPRLLERTRAILNINYPVLADWLESFGDLFQWQKPDCGAICFVGYDHPIESLTLVEQVRSRQSVLLVPGEHFGYRRHLRLGFGNEPAELQRALAALESAMRALGTG